MLEVVGRLIEAVGEPLARALIAAFADHEDPARAAEATIAHLAAQAAVRRALEIPPT